MADLADKYRPGYRYGALDLVGLQRHTHGPATSLRLAGRKVRQSLI